MQLKVKNTINCSLFLIGRQFAVNISAQPVKELKQIFITEKVNARFWKTPIGITLLTILDSGINNLF